MVETGTILQLIQFVALVLPANVILLQVLNRLFEEPYDLDNGMFVDLSRSFSSGPNTTLKPDVIGDWGYLLPKLALHTFVFAGFAFIAALGVKLDLFLFGWLSAEPVVEAGIVFLTSGFVFLGAPLLFVRPSIVAKAGVPVKAVRRNPKGFLLQLRPVHWLVRHLKLSKINGRIRGIGAALRDWLTV